MITIQDIAQKAKVSSGTVSRVVNNLDHVKPATRERVQKIIKEMGYVPDRAAINLAKRNTRRTRNKQRSVKSRNIGFFYWEKYVKNIALELVYSSLLEGVQRYFQNTNHLLHTFMIPEEFNLKSIVQNVKKNKMDGIILVGEIPQSFIRHLEDNGVPSTHFGSSSVYAKNSTIVTSDNFHGGYKATMYLVSQGHRRIGFVDDTRMKSAFGERKRGYMIALIESDIDFRKEYCLRLDKGIESGYKAMRDFMKLPQPPSAIFCAHDEAAYGVLKYCSENNIHVPGELSVVGFDDSYARYCNPALTTIRQPLLKTGKVVASELMSAITEKDYIVRKILFDLELIIRDSAAKRMD
ncbi:LacI family DNA-binding transcriptional regulator [Candidatus Sumerlaeota bacterium]|nr:LacI family DNA-binding transcriptional regulator [Candidatus Sumerlaeota bacterium]